jgi:glycosyltransferase involved in cell wall biosynthesis
MKLFLRPRVFILEKLSEQFELINGGINNLCILKVSIIIPVYNVEKFLDQCIISVIRQTLNEVEIICINDASTDNSLAILNKYAEIDHRIRIFSNFKNRGLSFSRNYGLDCSLGEYVYFLDADDMIIEETLDELYTEAKLQNLDSVYFDTKIIFQNDKIKKIWSRYKARRTGEYENITNGENMFIDFMVNKDYEPPVWKQFWRRAYLIKHDLKFPVGLIHEDIIFSFMAIMQAERVACIKKQYHKYYIRENSITTSPINENKFKSLFISYCKITAFSLEKNFSPKTVNAIDEYLDGLYETIKKMYKLSKLNSRLITFEDKLIQRIFDLMKNNLDEIEENNIIKDNIELIKKYDIVVICGAGGIAAKTWEILKVYGIDISAFLVSDKRSNAKKFIGKNVYDIKEFVNHKCDCLVLVATQTCYHRAMISTLKQYHFNNILVV